MLRSFLLSLLFSVSVLLLPGRLAHAESCLEVHGAEDSVRRRALDAELRARSLDASTSTDCSTNRVVVTVAADGIVLISARKPSGEMELVETIDADDDATTVRRAAEAIRALFTVEPPDEHASAEPPTSTLALGGAKKESRTTKGRGERPPPPPAERKHVALLANPLSLLSFGRRASIQIEVMLAKHHALTINPFYIRQPQRLKEHLPNSSLDTRDTPTDFGIRNALGGELGYRFYTGDRGPNGFFTGPSFIYARSWHTGHRAPEFDDFDIALGRILAVGDYNGSFNAYGAAFDIGGQFIFGPGIVIGFGVGVQYVVPSGSFGGALSYFSGLIGIAPRVLFALGYAF